MRENETLPAVLAFFVGGAMLSAAIAAFLIFVSHGGGAPAAEKVARPDCLDPNACREAAPEFAAEYNNAAACNGTEERVCLVPLGDVPKALVDHLVAYYREEYGLTLHVLPAVTLEPGFDQDRPGQLAAEYLQVMYTDAYGQYVGDPNVLLIGLTAIDIYTPDRPEWRWFFGYLDDRSAVISSFRMEPERWGKRANDALRNRRVRTLMNKYIAMGHYGLPFNDDPQSVLFRLIGGLDILDGIDERIPLEDPPTPIPTATLGPASSQEEETGREIAAVYIELMAAARKVVEPRPDASVLERRLAELRSTYLPRFEALGCLADAMNVAQRQQVFNAAEQYYDINSDDDFEWYDEALDLYGASSAAGVLLIAISGLVEYAVPDPYGQPRRNRTPC